VPEPCVIAIGQKTKWAKILPGFNFCQVLVQLLFSSRASRLLVDFGAA
jgi:hypothetical protein